MLQGPATTPQELAAAAEAPSKWLQLLSSMWAPSQPREGRRDRRGRTAVTLAYAHQVVVAEWVAFDWRLSQVPSLLQLLLVWAMAQELLQQEGREILPLLVERPLQGLTCPR